MTATPGHHAARGRRRHHASALRLRARRTRRSPTSTITCRIAPAPTAKRQRRPVRREGVAAEPDAGDRRQARERRERDEDRQPGPLLDQGRDDADALGDVVQREAEHQEGAERRGAGGEGRADRQPLAEVVQADAERDRGRERHPLRACRPGAAQANRSSNAVSAATSQTRPRRGSPAPPRPPARAPPRACRPAGTGAARRSAPARS